MIDDIVYGFLWTLLVLLVAAIMYLYGSRFGNWMAEGLVPPVRSIPNNHIRV